MSGRGRILVLDGTTGPALASVRALGRSGFEPFVGAALPGSLAARSRFSRGGFVHPDPALDAGAFVDATLRAATSFGADLVLPVTDWSAVPLTRARDRLGDVAPRIALPPGDAFDLALSKSRTVALARDLAIPVPPTWVLGPGVHWPPGAPPPEPLPRTPPFPCVLKPDRSKVWDAEGRGSALQVVYAGDLRALRGEVLRLSRHGPVVVQPWLPGVGIGLGVLADRGEVVLAFQHRRLHEVPLTGGGSTWRVSEPVDPALLEMARALMARLRWHGVAMVEARRSPEGGLVLVEVNGRLWGSLPLAVAAGADFPTALAALLLEGRRPEPRPYREGLRVRSLAGEVEWVAAALRRETPPVPIDVPGPGRVALDVLTMLDPRERWDALSVTDPGPAAVQVRTAIARVRAAVRRRSARRRMEAARARPERLRAHLRAARNVLVVCQGNVLRSALAGALLAEALGDEVEIASAGLGAEPGRPAHPWAVERARAHGESVVERLRGHAASPLEDALVRAADVVLVMDVDQLLEVEGRHPDAAGRTWLLAAVLPEGPLDVLDPIDGTPEAVDFALGTVEAAVRAIVSARRARA